MPWAKFSDDAHRSEHILALSHAGYRLWSTSIMDNRSYKGGRSAFISVVRAQALAAQQGVPRRTIDELVRSGRWEPVEGGWKIHHYEQFLPTVSELREGHDPDPVKQRAGQLGAAARWQRDSTHINKEEGAPVAAGIAEPSQTDSPARARARGPVPVPVPSVSKEAVRDNALLGAAEEEPNDPELRRRMVSYVEWLCDHKGWPALPADRLVRERDRGLKIAALHLPEDVKFGEFNRGWDAAEDKPETLGYWWQGLQDLENASFKTNGSRQRTSGLTHISASLPDPSQAAPPPSPVEEPDA